MLHTLFGIHKNKTLRRRLDQAIYTLLRFTIYGMVGVVAEVANYTFVKVGRMHAWTAWIFQADWQVDPRLGLGAIWGEQCKWWSLYGQCSLWMFPVYGLCALLLIEPIYRYCRLHQRSVLVRGFLYALAILAFEFCSGFILRWLTGFDIWRYTDRFNILEMTSVYLFPLWFATGLFVELIYRELTGSGLRKKADEVAKNIIA